jgi:hypothetical protein
MALFDFLKITLLPLDKWPYFFGQLLLNSKVVQLLLACQLYKVKKLRTNAFLESYECPCKQLLNSNK